MAFGIRLEVGLAEIAKNIQVRLPLRTLADNMDHDVGSILV